MKISQIIHWFLRMFVYACMGTSAILLLYDFENNSWYSPDQMKGARESEGRINIGSMNRAQQAYYLENNNFSNSIDNLGLGIMDTNNYSYRILSPMNPVQNVEELKPLPLDEKSKIAFATPQRTDLKSYIAIVWTLQNYDYNATTSAICQRKKEQISYPSILPEISDNQILCPPGFEVLE